MSGLNVPRHSTGRLCPAKRPREPRSAAVGKGSSHPPSQPIDRCLDPPFPTLFRNGLPGGRCLPRQTLRRRSPASGWVGVPRRRPDGGSGGGYRSPHRAPVPTIRSPTVTCKSWVESHPELVPVAVKLQGKNLSGIDGNDLDRAHLVVGEAAKGPPGPLFLVDQGSGIVLSVLWHNVAFLQSIAVGKSSLDDRRGQPQAGMQVSPPAGRTHRPTGTGTETGGGEGRPDGDHAGCRGRRVHRL